MIDTIKPISGRIKEVYILNIILQVELEPIYYDAAVEQVSQDDSSEH